jgi:hypothetical protein
LIISLSPTSTLNCRQVRQRVRDVRMPLIEILFIPRPQVNAAARFRRNRAVAIELPFVKLVRPLAKERHRLDEFGFGIPRWNEDFT